MIWLCILRLGRGDEKKGKKIALSFGIDTIGLIGILLVYKKKKYLSNDEITYEDVLLSNSL